MNDKEFENQLLGMSAGSSPSPSRSVDVRSRVQSSLQKMAHRPSFEFTSVACCALAVATAIVSVVIWLPSMKIVVEPWGVYFI